MTEYVIRDGVIMTSILDQYLLVSTKACRDKCSYVRLINDTAAYYWDLLEKEYSIEQMADQAIKDYGLTAREEVLTDIHDLLEMLKKLGYLLSDEEIKKLYG